MVGKEEFIKLKKVDLRPFFNNKGFKVDESDTIASLTPWGTTFPPIIDNSFLESSYDICSQEKLDNVECDKTIINIEAKQNFSCLGIIGLGIHGDYVENLGIKFDYDKQFIDYEVTFPYMNRTITKFSNTDVFYTSDYVYSQFANRKIYQNISLFEIKIFLPSNNIIKQIRLPENLCTHIFALSLF